MYKIKINEQYNFEIENEKNVLKVNNEIVDIDSIHLSDSRSHVIYKNKSFNVEFISEDKENKSYLIKVNGSTYQVAVEDKFDQLLKALGMDHLSSNKVQEIKAPMPGLVLNIMVKEGQEVKKGDSLLILEAMKMENIIKSTTDGIVKKIRVNQGDKVEKNAILIQFG